MWIFDIGSERSWGGGAIGGDQQVKQIGAWADVSDTVAEAVHVGVRVGIGVLVALWVPVAVWVWEAVREGVAVGMGVSVSSRGPLWAGVEMHAAEEKRTLP